MTAAAAAAGAFVVYRPGLFDTVASAIEPVFIPNGLVERVMAEVE